MLPRYPRQNTKSLKTLWAYSFIMCQRIGRPPISTMGLGRYSVSSRTRGPSPPHSITTFTRLSWQALVLASPGKGPGRKHQRLMYAECLGIAKTATGLRWAPCSRFNSYDYNCKMPADGYAVRSTEVTERLAIDRRLGRL